MSDFVRKSIMQKLNRKNFITRIEKMERWGTASPSASVQSLDEISPSVFGDSGAIDGSGITLPAGEYPYTTFIRWVTDDTQAKISELLSYYSTTGGSSAAILAGQAKTTGESGRAALWANDETGTLKTQFVIDSDGPILIVQTFAGAARISTLPAAGWQPIAFPMGYSTTLGTVASVNLAANGGSVAMPMMVNAPMLLDSVSVRNTNTGTARTWGWDLYVQSLNSGSTDENELDRVACGNADETFTPGASTTRTITAATSPGAGDGPVYIGPGVYWLVPQCRHATNAFGIGNWASGFGTAANISMTKTTTNPNGATLDFVAATWTKGNSIYFAYMNGRVFGETASW
jgi:hypothetical protein